MWWIVFTKLLLLVLPLINSQQNGKTAFSCEGRPSGYYADVSTGCQVYHMCDGLGRQFSYTCPNATLFQQRMLICDHWYMVNCTRAEADYGANLLIGQQKPFVDDSEYYRTPRPDLLSASMNETEFNIIYRTGRRNMPSQVVGIEPKIGDYTPENQTSYFPPSHWSTKNGQESNTNTGTKIGFGHQHQDGYRSIGNNRKTGAKAIDRSFHVNRNGNHFTNDKLPPNSNSKVIPPLIRTSKPDLGNGRLNVVFESNFKATTPVYPLSVELTSEEPDEAGVLPPQGSGAAVNFASNFKATTPVYPTSVEPTSPNPNIIGLSPPQGFTNRASTIHVNFESNFKATTPVYPLSVEPSSPNSDDVGLLPPEGDSTQTPRVPVNFASNFKATTPVYPLTVEPTSPNPDVIGLLAPGENSLLHINFASNFKATTPVYPKSVESTSLDPDIVGLLAPQEINSNVIGEKNYVVFKSNFTATTPVYPTSVEPTSPNPVDTGLLPPQDSKDTVQHTSSNQENKNIPSLLLDILPPKFDESYKSNRDPNIQTTVSPPSKFYQAPKQDPDFTIPEVETNDQLGIRINNFMKSLSGSQWHDLREEFKIPEYDFPLEENGRPGYEGTMNSFDAKQMKNKK